MEYWDGEYCKCCTREQRLAWATTDYLWNEVVTEYYRVGRVLCLECFLKMAEDRNIRVNLGDVWFQGLAGNP